jgi:hypothetical protein
MASRLNLSIAGAAVVATLAGIALDRTPIDAQSKQAPIFEVDPWWPQPLPNHWVTGSTIGLSVDAQDNVWTIHRPNTVEDNFKAADLMVGDARGADDEVLAGSSGAEPFSPMPEQEFVLYAEVVEYEKKIVPKERVRLQKEVVEEVVDLRAEVRKEEVDVTGATAEPTFR